MKKSSLFLLLAVAIFVLGFFVSTAQENVTLTPEQLEQIKNNPPGPSLAEPNASIEGSVNCFDYYKFGSVQVDVESEIPVLIPGVPMTLKGKIKNENNYPVVDGRVYVKIFRKQEDLDKAHANGNYLVDQFIAVDGISLNSKEEKDVHFVWNVPHYAVGGEYQMAAFFFSAKKFNLLGLSFTDDVVGNIFNFSVNSPNKETVEFDKNAVKINDQDYHFAAFPPRAEKDQEVSVKATLVNSTKTAQTVPVSYTLYEWDGQSEENKIVSREEKVQLAAGESKELEYKVSENKNPVFYMVLEAKYNDSKSVLGIRFVRSGVDKVRLNFPAVTSYPLKKDQQSTLFSCLHNSGQAASVDDNKMFLTLLDEDGKEIHKYEYSGAVSGAMMGLKDDFVPKKDYENFSIKAEIFTGGKLVDSAVMEYECSKIDPTVCREKTVVSETSASREDGSRKNLIIWLSVAFVAVMVLLMAFFVIREKRSENNVY